MVTRLNGAEILKLGIVTGMMLKPPAAEHALLTKYLKRVLVYPSLPSFNCFFFCFLKIRNFHENVNVVSFHSEKVITLCRGRKHINFNVQRQKTH